MNTTDSSPILWGTRQPLPRSRRSTGSNMATACDQCHRCKVRCSGGRPSCERCQSYGSTCTYSLGKPLGKPPKNGRRKPLPSQPQSQPQPSRPPQFPTPHAHSPSNSHAGSAQNGGAEFVALESGSVPTTNGHAARTEEVSIHVEGGEVGNGEPQFETPMQLEHDFTSTNSLLPSYKNAEQYLSHDNSHTLFSGSENGLNFFNGTENTEEINLDFLGTDFCTDSWTNAKSKDNVSSSPLHLDVAMTNDDRFDSPFISPPHSLPLITPPDNQEPPDTQIQAPTSPRTEKAVIIIPETAATTTNNKNENENKTCQHLPLLLEITLRLYFESPSTTQSSISEALRLARQGLQAVQQCLPKFSVPPPAPVPFESSSHDASSSRLGSRNTESESSSILACILLLKKVILCYESLLKRHSGSGSSSVDVSSPSAPSPVPSTGSTTSKPTISSSLVHHLMQPIFIGDFEVQSKASWKVILDAVVRAEKQEAKYMVSKLENWANELVGRGKNEGHLAMTFLEPLKQRFDS